MTKRSMNFGFVIPTHKEDAAMEAGIAADPDTVEFKPAEIARPRAA